MKSSEIIKTNIIKDTSLLTVSKFILLGISLVSAMLLSRFRTLEEYGTYSQLLSVISIGISLILLGVPQSINYFLSKTNIAIEKKNFLQTYYTYNMIIGLTLGLVLSIMSSYIAAVFNNFYIIGFAFFLALYPVTKVIVGTIDNLLIIEKKSGKLLIFRVTNGILLLIAIYISYLNKLSFQEYMIIFLSIEVLYLFISMIIVYKLYGVFTFKINLSILKKILYYSIPLGLASFVGTINIEIDKIMMSLLTNPEQVAIYTNASRELPLIIISTSVTAVLMPDLVRLLSKNKFDESIRLWKSSIVLTYCILVFLIFGVYIFAEDVIILLYSEKYLPGKSIFSIFLIITLMRTTYFGIILNSMGKTKYIFISSIIALLLNVSFNYLLFLLLGAEGLAYSSFLSQVIINLIQLIITSKITGISFSHIFPWRSLAVMTFITALFAVVFSALKSFINLDIFIGSLLESILLSIIWGIIHFALFWKLLLKQFKVLQNNNL